MKTDTEILKEIQERVMDYLNGVLNSIDFSNEVVMIFDRNDKIVLK